MLIKIKNENLKIIFKYCTEHEMAHKQRAELTVPTIFLINIFFLKKIIIKKNLFNHNNRASHNLSTETAPKVEYQLHLIHTSENYKEPKRAMNQMLLLQSYR